MSLLGDIWHGANRPAWTMRMVTFVLLVFVAALVAQVLALLLT